MTPTQQRQLIRAVGAAAVTLLVGEIIRRTISPAAAITISPFIMVAAHNMLDDLATQLVSTAIGAVG